MKLDEPDRYGTKDIILQTGDLKPEVAETLKQWLRAILSEKPKVL